MKLVTAIAVILLITGCVSRPAAVLTQDVRPIRKASFEMVDQRPADERTTRWLSNVADSCTFTLRQLGDEAISPDRFQLLADSLNPNLLAGKTLRVTHFGIYINSSQRSRSSEFIRGGEGLAQALSDDAMGRRVERLCRSEEIAEGWLDRDYGTTPHSVVIVQITLVLDGKTHRVRGFFLADRQISAGTRASETAAAISSAIKKASDQLVAELVAVPCRRAAGC